MNILYPGQKRMKFWMYSVAWQQIPYPLHKYHFRCHELQDEKTHSSPGRNICQHYYSKFKKNITL